MNTPESTSIENRLRLVEDTLTILNILAASPLSSDVASETYWQEIFADDAVMDRGGDHGLEGRDEIMKIVRSDSQAAAIESGMAHVAALPHIQIERDRAVATGYLQVLIPDPAGLVVNLPGKGQQKALATYYLSTNRWEFARTDKGWKIVKRIVRPFATPDGQSLLSRGIDSINR